MKLKGLLDFIVTTVFPRRSRIYQQSEKMTRKESWLTQASFSRKQPQVIPQRFPTELHQVNLPAEGKKLCLFYELKNTDDNKELLNKKQIQNVPQLVLQDSEQASINRGQKLSYEFYACGGYVFLEFMLKIRVTRSLWRNGWEGTVKSTIMRGEWVKSFYASHRRVP